MLGKFQLLIKRYAGAIVSNYMYKLKLGDRVQFKHIKFNVKKQYPFTGIKTVRAGSADRLLLARSGHRRTHAEIHRPSAPPVLTIIIPR